MEGGYSIDASVLYKNRYYQSTTSSNSSIPTNKEYWIEINNVESNWGLVNIWEPNKYYDINTYIVYNKILYRSTGKVDLGQNPELSKKWNAVYSIIPESNKEYRMGVENNSIIFMNNRYYICNSSDSSNRDPSFNPPSILNNGIVIYINKKWKNILININIGDDTYPNISNTNRDIIYTELYKKLTAANFINSLNDITNKYDFNNYISYIVVDESGSDIRKFSLSLNNLKDLPFYIKCEEPDELNVKVDSLFKRLVNLPNPLNPFKKLDNGKISDISQLNYYNNIPVAANIIENQYPAKVFENYHGNKNIITNQIFRYSGYYMPIFCNISLFEVDEYNLGNYKFDTTLTDFGIVKERKVRKINRKGDILRLSNINDEKSIYPMLDEFGYSIYDFFIFSSTWDLRYYIETTALSINKDYLQKYIDESTINTFDNINIPITIPNDIGQK
jgi:hypothetical protein